MRHNQNRRSRGRSRKGPNPLTRSYESNGPDVKVRGNAAHVAEKYMSLARDAHVAGDVVAAENYLQHAEHYNRIVMAAQAQFQQSQPQFREGGEERLRRRPADERPRRATASNRTAATRTTARSFRQPGRAASTARQSLREWRRRGRRRPRLPPPPARQGRQNENDRGSARPRDRFDRRPDYATRPASRQPRQPRPPRALPACRRAAARDCRSQRQPQLADAAPPPVEERRVAPARRRRGRPPREGAEVAATQEGDDATPDGAAALAAFPD